MLEITSMANTTIKNVKKLQQKKFRQSEGRYLVEGYHLVDEALKANIRYYYLLATPEAMEKVSDRVDMTSGKIIQINQMIADSLSETKNSQDIFMVLPIHQPGNYSFNYGKWVLLDDLTDPGNVGTIIRTADAAGFTGVVLSNNSVDLYNSKVQRSMQGSQFHMPILRQDIIASIANFKEHDLPILVSLLNDKAQSVFEYEAPQNFGLVIGNEAHGANVNVIDQADQELYIPIFGKAESLNAAVAAGILIYQLV